MKKPKISENFTIEDIHAIREYHNEMRKKMSLEQRLAFINKSATECEIEIEEYRKNRIAM